MVAINDRVKETTTTTGTGTVQLAGATPGFETFVERIGAGNATYYCIALQGGGSLKLVLEPYLVDLQTRCLVQQF